MVWVFICPERMVEKMSKLKVGDRVEITGGYFLNYFHTNLGTISKIENEDIWITVDYTDLRISISEEFFIKIGGERIMIFRDKLELIITPHNINELVNEMGGAKELANEMGLTIQTVRNWITGKNKPQLNLQTDLYNLICDYDIIQVTFCERCKNEIVLDIEEHFVSTQYNHMHRECGDEILSFKENWFDKGYDYYNSQEEFWKLEEKE